MSGQELYEKDVVSTSGGDLEIGFLGHASLVLTYQGKKIYIDPFHEVADYSKLPPADAILITHTHGDHLDPQALAFIRKEKTTVIYTQECAQQLAGGTILRNGETGSAAGIGIQAVPAYNLVHKREDGQPWHPKGNGNGYVLTVGDKRIYIAGDTENIPEMKSLSNIYCAFLPMNIPYTMTPEMTADAAKSFGPKILYPYHFGKTDTAKIIELLASNKEIEIRIRRMS